MTDDELPIAEAVELRLQQAQKEAEVAFGRGYTEGRSDQLREDRYYIDRVTELSRLLASAEAEIQRLRNK
jgi:flagellar biosynthesis/type III secretory pathway protein FliH